MTLYSIPAFSAIPDEAAAVGEIRRCLDDERIQALLFFVSTDYDLERIATALRYSFPMPVLGCTTAGHIGPGGYLHKGIQAVAICGSSISVTLEPIHPLAQCQTIVANLGRRIEQRPAKAGFRRFGLLLVDGLARMEERLAASLHHCLPEMPLIGGSAGDDLAFKSTFVYADGRFISDAAVLAIFETSYPFTAFKFQHFAPTDEILVITKADEQTRTVVEINGEPAALHYARRLGLSVEELSPEIFSKYPVMLRLGSEYYVRSIQHANDDLSLTFYCAIAKGIVLRLGQAVSPLETARSALAEVRKTVPNPSLIIGCDCILRRLEFEQRGLAQSVGELLARNKVIGFSTYGEQFNALHMNQTFTGLALGGD